MRANIACRASRPFLSCARCWTRSRPTTAAEANLSVKSHPDLGTPDLHIWHVEAPYASEVTAKYAVEGTWSISPGLVRPESRGSLRLKSANPKHHIEIHANMLGDPRDIVALRKGMEISRELGNSAAMKRFAKRELLPGPLKGEALDNLIRDGAMSMHHPSRGSSLTHGTARLAKTVEGSRF
jgi:choline dehydrogenase